MLDFEGISRPFKKNPITIHPFLSIYLPLLSWLLSCFLFEFARGQAWAYSPSFPPFRAGTIFYLSQALLSLASCDASDQIKRLLQKVELGFAQNFAATCNIEICCVTS